MNDDGKMATGPAYSPLEVLDHQHEADLRDGMPLVSLQEASDQQWNAFIQSGHQSDFSNLTTMQRVLLSQCNSPHCPTVKRQLLHGTTITLRFPKNIDHTDPVSICQLIEEPFQEGVDPARQCPNTSSHKLHADNRRLATQVTRVSRAGQVFAVEIDRTRSVLTLPEGLTEAEQIAYFQAAADNPFLNRLQDYQSIALNLWANTKDIEVRSALTNPPQQERFTRDSVTSMYEVCGIVAYSARALHYTVFVKIEDEWTYFDDLQQFPSLRDPFSSWPDGFSERLLFYKRADLAPSGISAIRQNVVIADAQQQDAGPSSMSAERPAGQLAEQIHEPQKESAALQVKGTPKIASNAMDADGLTAVEKWIQSMPPEAAGWLNAIPKTNSPRDIARLFDFMGSIFKSALPVEEELSHPNPSIPRSLDDDAGVILTQHESALPRQRRVATSYPKVQSAVKESASGAQYTNKGDGTGARKRKSHGEMDFRSKHSRLPQLAKRTAGLPSGKTIVGETVTDSAQPAQMLSIGTPCRSDAAVVPTSPAPTSTPRTPTSRQQTLDDGRSSMRNRRQRSVRSTPATAITRPIATRTPREEDSPTTAGSLTDVTTGDVLPVPPPIVDRKIRGSRDELPSGDKAAVKTMARLPEDVLSGSPVPKRERQQPTRTSSALQLTPFGSRTMARSERVPDLLTLKTFSSSTVTRRPKVIFDSDDEE